MDKFHAIWSIYFYSTDDNIHDSYLVINECLYHQLSGVSCFPEMEYHVLKLICLADKSLDVWTEGWKWQKFYFISNIHHKLKAMFF